jgi:4-amino-4-deoxy-L-arabinose transferase-like glycosyltransferase
VSGRWRIGAAALAFDSKGVLFITSMRRPAAPMFAWSALTWAPLTVGDRLAAALVDPRRRERHAVLALAAYVGLWTLYGVIAKGSQDIHFDMGEALAWSRELAVGNPKHPPLSAYVVKVWFSVFPRTDWAYYLLAVTVAAVGLWIAWMLSARWLDPEKRIAGLALLSLVPFFNFHALKFNANSVLIPLWAATTWSFMRSFESRRIPWAALAGLCAAGAMLGKYWSIVLLGGLAVAALVDPRRGAYFRSAAPWVTILVGALALSGHAVWLVNHGFGPILYAASEHTSPGTLATLTAALGFLLGTAGYIAIPVAVAFMAAQPTRAALIDTVWPHTCDRRFANIAFVAPLLLSVLLALASGALIVSLWAMPALTLLPVVMLSSPQLAITRETLTRLVSLAITFPVVMLAAAPGIALMRHRTGLEHHAAHYRLLAQAVDQAWSATSRQPLALVGSDTNLVNGVVFYLAAEPSTYDILGPRETPWVDAGRIAREGIAMFCAADESGCVNAADSLAAKGPKGKRIELEIRRSYLGLEGAPQRYLIETMPPSAPR